MPRFKLAVKTGDCSSIATNILIHSLGLDRKLLGKQLNVIPITLKQQTSITVLLKTHIQLRVFIYPSLTKLWGRSIDRAEKNIETNQTSLSCSVIVIETFWSSHHVKNSHHYRFLRFPNCDKHLMCNCWGVQEPFSKHWKAHCKVLEIVEPFCNCFVLEKDLKICAFRHPHSWISDVQNGQSYQ